MASTTDTVRNPLRDLHPAHLPERPTHPFTGQPLTDDQWDAWTVAYLNGRIDALAGRPAHQLDCALWWATAYGHGYTEARAD